MVLTVVTCVTWFAVEIMGVAVCGPVEKGVTAKELWSVEDYVCSSTALALESV